MLPRHGTAEAMALDLGLQGGSGAVRWDLGAEPLPSPEQQGANLLAFVQGMKGRAPVAPPATATTEEKAAYADAARLAEQGRQTAAGVAQLRQRFAPLPTPVAAPAAESRTGLLVAAALTIGFLMWLGGKD